MCSTKSLHEFWGTNSVCCCSGPSWKTLNKCQNTLDRQKYYRLVPEHQRADKGVAPAPPHPSYGEADQLRFPKSTLSNQISTRTTKINQNQQRSTKINQDQPRTSINKQDQPRTYKNNQD